MEYLNSIINSELSKIAFIALVIVPIYWKLGVFRKNGNGKLTKEKIKQLLDNHKQEFKTNDFLHIGEDLGEIKQMLKDSKEWQEKHTKDDDERFKLLFKKRE